MNSGVRKLLLCIAAAAGLVAVCRVCFGPFRIPSISVNSPLNAEGIFGLSITLAMWGRMSSCVAVANRRSQFPLALAAVGITALALAACLRLGFLSDDWILVKTANQSASTASLFTSSRGGYFFRPVGDLSFALDAAFAHFNPLAWHISALALHLVNVALVFLLAVTLGFPRFAAFTAAVLFGVHGTRPEAAAWVAGRFDLLATTFTLVTLIAFIRARETQYATAWDAAGLLAMTLALLTKESVYIIPALLAAWAVFHARRQLRSVAPYFAVAVAIFVYRWVLLGGIGGYAAANGSGLAFFPTLKALGIRIWAAMYFPINWSTEPGTALRALMIATVPVILYSAYKSAADIRFPLAFFFLGVLPPLQLLGIGTTLANSRVLYLPSVGFCLLLARVVANRYTAACVLIAFQIAALEHNLASWKSASDTVERACTAAAYTPNVGSLSVTGLPTELRGVPAFANGFRECVEIEAKRPVNVIIGRDGATLLVWDEKREQLVCSRGCS